MKKSKDNFHTNAHTLQLANQFMVQAQRACSVLLEAGAVAPFNSELRGASPRECFNALTFHRFVNKYSVPNPATDRARKLKCYHDWVAFEEKLFEFDFKESISRLDKADKIIVNRARYSLHRMLNRARFKPCAFDIEFTPGETFVSQGGRVSLIHKLGNSANWTITWAALDAAVDLINHSRGCLLNSLVHHYVRANLDVYPTDPTLDELVAQGVESATRESIYRMMCRVCTFTEGARAATVPKNSTDDRFINCEPFWNVILQRGLSVSYLCPIAKRIGNDLGTAQADHKRLISSACATIDFSKASDSVHYDCVEFFFPRHVFSYIASTRSYSTWISDLDLTIPNAKISPMGNGFTFEIMTIILLSIARELDSEARVCGDDVIINNQSADAFIRIASSIGFTINNQKTFVNSNFRESCGGFYHDDFGYLETYELTYIKSIRDLYTTCNKLQRMISNAPEGSNIEWMVKLRRNLMHLVPAFAKGPSVKAFDEGESCDYKENHGLDCGFVVSDNWIKTQRSCTTTRELFKRKALIHAEFLRLNYHCKMVGIIVIPVWCPKGTWAATDFVNHAEYAAYLHGMRRPRATIRGKGKWKNSVYLVTDSGLLVSSSYLASLRV